MRAEHNHKDTKIASCLLQFKLKLLFFKRFPVQEGAGATDMDSGLSLLATTNIFQVGGPVSRNI